MPVPPKPLKPGVEVDAWCTKCKMDLLHRIIAMQGDKVLRVECRTCNGHHSYRAPKASAPDPRTVKSSTPRRVLGASPRQPSARALSAAEAERVREGTWEKAVGG